MENETKQIQELHSTIHKNFTYISDKTKYDTVEKWECLYEDFSCGYHIQGDCEDFAMTFCEAAINKGVDRHRVGLATVATHGRGAPTDHAVAVYRDTNGADWMSDCNLDFLVPVTDVQYQFRSIMWCSQPGEWFDINDG